MCPYPTAASSEKESSLDRQRSPDIYHIRQPSLASAMLTHIMLLFLAAGGKRNGGGEKGGTMHALDSAVILPMEGCSSSLPCSSSPLHDIYDPLHSTSSLPCSISPHLNTMHLPFPMQAMGPPYPDPLALYMTYPPHLAPSVLTH